MNVDTAQSSCRAGARSEPARALRRGAPFGSGSERRESTPDQSPSAGWTPGRKPRRPGPPNELLLLRQAQHGDQYAERLLIDLHEPLARRVSRGFFLANGDEGDLLQGARV